MIYDELTMRLIIIIIKIIMSIIHYRVNFVLFQAVCSGCSGGRAPLKYKQWEPQRVCDACFTKLEAGNPQDSLKQL